jgi:hypothetical protein
LSRVLGILKTHLVTLAYICVVFDFRNSVDKRLLEIVLLPKTTDQKISY